MYLCGCPFGNVLVFFLINTRWSGYVLFGVFLINKRWTVYVLFGVFLINKRWSGYVLFGFFASSVALPFVPTGRGKKPTHTGQLWQSKCFIRSGRQSESNTHRRTLYFCHACNKRRRENAPVPGS